MRAISRLCAVALSFAATAHAQISDIGDPEDTAREMARGGQLESTTSTEDPWEGFNRRMFAINDGFDQKLIIPTAKAYRAVTHKKQRKGVRNFLANARTPIVFMNDVLQGEFRRAGNTIGRFAINSTIGFGGMGDPAERLGIGQHSEDFGQTLGVWGVPTGPYLVLPFFGPSTLRDGVGAAVDTVADPLFHVRTDAAQFARFSRAGVTIVAVREPLIEPLDQIRADSLDYYASVRSFYLQSRQREIRNGRTNFEDLPDIGDFEDFEEIE